jgi:hypothetical protein
MKPVTHPRRGRPTLAHSPFDNQLNARNTLRCLALAAIFALLAVVVAGCGLFDPKRSGGKPPDVPPQYQVPFNPTIVLENLQTAYSHRDSVGYKANYDSSYTGTSKDFLDPQTPTISLTYADEVAHIARLASDPTITSAYMSLGPKISWDRLQSDDPSHPDWAVIQIAGSQLDVQVEQPPDTWKVGGSSEFFTFKFKPTTPASISPTDTLWNIVRWEESRSP